MDQNKKSVQGNFAIIHLVRTECVEICSIIHLVRTVSELPFSNIQTQPVTGSGRHTKKKKANTNNRSAAFRDTC